MKQFGPRAAGLALLAAFCFASAAQAQLPWRWFGSKSSDKNPPAKVAPADLRHAVEVNVEVAWLADPVTFPYYLEAHVNGSQQVEVRGYVPNKTVREHALRTAQVYSSMPVTDAMKEHPSLLVRPSPMAAEQLRNSVVSSLKVALPRQYQQLKVDCDDEGKVYVVGVVGSYDEKIAVSHSLRRLHGCTSVQNMTSVPVEIARTSAPPAPEKAPAGPVTKSAESKAWSWWPWAVAKGNAKQDAPPVDPRTKPEPKGATVIDVSAKANANDAPILIPPMIAAKDKDPDSGVRAAVEAVKSPEAPAKTGLSAAELEKRIRQACPTVTRAEVIFNSKTSLRIDMTIRSSNDINSVAESIFAMPELQNFSPDIRFKVGS